MPRRYASKDFNKKKNKNIYNNFNKKKNNNNTITENENNENENNESENEDNNKQIIMSLNSEETRRLLTSINTRTRLNSALNDNNKKYTNELQLYINQIFGLNKTINTDLPDYLKIMAQEQLDNALIEKVDLEKNYKKVITQHNDDMQSITNLFTNYDWNIDMTESVIDRIKYFEKLNYIEKISIEKERLALIKRENDKLIIHENEQLFNHKKQYVINKCIPYLLDNKKIYNLSLDLSKLIDDNYLNKLISDAHRSHYRDICDHFIDLNDDNDNDDTFTYEDSIKDCNGRYQYSDESVYDQKTGEVINPCCHKRFCFGVSKDILKFSCSESFNMDTKTCLCQDDIPYTI
jgi:hypothetical protein